MCRASRKRAVAAKPLLLGNGAVPEVLLADDERRLIVGRVEEIAVLGVGEAGQHGVGQADASSSQRVRALRFLQA